MRGGSLVIAKPHLNIRVTASSDVLWGEVFSFHDPGKEILHLLDKVIGASTTKVGRYLLYKVVFLRKRTLHLPKLPREWESFNRPNSHEMTRKYSRHLDINRKGLLNAYSCKVSASVVHVSHIFRHHLFKTASIYHLNLTVFQSLDHMCVSITLFFLVTTIGSYIYSGKVLIIDMKLLILEKKIFMHQKIGASIRT